MTKPDKWVIIKIQQNKDSKPVYKVLASFYGGYLEGDAWKMNSGIVSVELNKGSYEFNGYSGSIYACDPNKYGLTSLTSSIFNNYKSKITSSDIVFEILDENTDWLNLNKKL